MTAQPRQALQGNRILDALPAGERRLLATAVEAFDIGHGEVLCALGATVRHVYFPRRGMVSLFAQVAGSPAVGVGLIRSEGMFGLGAVVGDDTSSVLAVAQGLGQGDRVETAAFRNILQSCPALKGGLLAYANAVLRQRSQNTACVAFHPSRTRLARWMLDVTEGGDGADGRGFRSTQAAMAAALGLQRPAVSQIASGLQRSGLIRYARGGVTILDRPALRAAACGCSIPFAGGLRQN